MTTSTSRIEALDWAAMASSLDAHGCAVTGPLLTAEECAALAARYAEDGPFRSRVDHGPPRLRPRRIQIFRLSAARTRSQALRTALYPRLAAIANRWNEAMGIAVRFPADAQGFPRSAATRPASQGRRRCSCNTAPATTIACIRTFTASTCFRCRRRCCCRSRARISPAASSC